ncbi:hypothetical protein [Pseudoclavibacter sp. VKM Ac-2888]|uniref:hypothetical protein n=1 Tax=Pseudoclavibacter sp. VKM Ac-2888 TaxID=2783830 RepID=UPI00188B6753|nr:hypothetical protein [Pseudoclavibacter sp. VKM Ac-2888]MBF4549323.1 hypothetical protein [Pseudoclavibacter sp. VKM Ac-2888]
MDNERTVKHTNNNVKGWTKNPTRVIGIAIQREAPKPDSKVVRSEALWSKTGKASTKRYV